MVVKKVLVPAKEWQADTSIAIRKYLPAGFNPSDFVHYPNGDMLVLWDDEKPYVPPVAVEIPPAVPAETPKVEHEPIVPDVDKTIEGNLVLPPDEVPAPMSTAVVTSQPRSIKKSKKK